MPLADWGVGIDQVADRQIPDGAIGVLLFAGIPALAQRMSRMFPHGNSGRWRCEQAVLLNRAAGRREGADEGFKLLLVLPGGDGSADFNPFVRRIHKNALDGSYVVAELVAPAWSADPIGSSGPRRQIRRRR